MRLDLIQSKPYKEEFRFFRILTAIFSFVLGLLPAGYFMLFPSLLYLCTREDQSHYIAMISFTLGCLYYGWIYAVMMLVLILVWNALTQIASFSLRHQMTWIVISSIVLSIVVSWLIRWPWPYAGIMIILQYLGFEVTKLDFHQDQKTLRYFACLILFLTMSFIMREYVSMRVGLAFLSGFLLFYSMILSSRKVLYLILLVMVGYAGADVFDPSGFYNYDWGLWMSTAVPLIVAAVMPKQKFKRWLIYVSLVTIVFLWQQDHLAAVFYILSSCLMLVPDSGSEDTLWLEDPWKQKADALSYRQTNTLLHRFALIFQELAKRNQNIPYLETVANAFALCEEELKTTYLKETDIKHRVEEILRAYSFPLDKVAVEKNDVILIKLWIRQLHPSELDSMIIPLLSNGLSLPFHTLDYQKAGFFDSYHRITLSSQRGLSLLYDQIQHPIQRECGDAILVKNKGEEMYFLMSDGMGSGKQASSQSTFVLSLMEQFLDANVPVKTAIKLVNQLALLQGEERYATLDVLWIDRFRKKAMLYKSGSMQTYLVRGTQVYSFFGASLPLGIIERINPEYYSFDLKEGDLLLMLSDGADHELMKQWLKEEAESNPARLLRHLYQKRLEQPVNDDISMLLIRIKKDTSAF